MRTLSNLWSSVIILLLVPLTHGQSDYELRQISCTPVRDTCTFYSCIDLAYDCGPSGYPLGYGLKYCTAFKDDRTSWSPKGQQWLSDVMLCLQTFLAPYLETLDMTSCDELSDAAFGSHAKCYVDSGFCTLPPSDWERLVDIIGFETLFQEETVMEALETGERCIKRFLEFLDDRKPRDVDEL